MDDVIMMTQSCSKCGLTTRNDDPTIRHPLDFLNVLRAGGWSIHETQPHNHPTLCRKCAGN